jgi:hypothetical protein
LAFLFIFSSIASAQSRRVEITPFGGYILGGSIKFYEGKFKIENSASYGGMLAVEIDRGYLIELSYTRMDSEGEWQPYSGFADDYPETTIDVAVNHLQIGSVKELELDNEMIRPYGTFTLGTTWFHPKTDQGEDEWLFSVTGALGLKYFFTERIGIRVQARLLLPLIFEGAGFYMGIGTGGVSSGVGVTSTVPIVQGDFTGGLIIALGE